MSDGRTPREPIFIGNQTWLDFINTELVEGGEAVDLIEDKRLLVAWLVRVGLLAPDERNAAERRWDGSRDGERVVEEALGLRATLRRMAERLVEGEAAPDDAVEAINRVLRAKRGYAQVRRTGDGYERAFAAEDSGPLRLLHGVAESAAGFLTGSDSERVKQCVHPGCILYFYDTTKNRGRRYCSTATCGNRARVAAHYRRTAERRG